MAIKIFDLCCANGHHFEGWFSSLEDLQNQNDRGLIACPVCSNTEITRLPSASHIGKKSGEGEEERTPERAEIEAIVKEKFQAVMAMVRDAAAKAEDVGDNFAREARDIQAGLAPARTIRGRCTAREAAELVEEGSAVLPVPESSGKTLN